MSLFKPINVFVSCPSDIIEELDSIKLIFNEINKTSGIQNNFRLEFINWDLDVYTGIGDDPQDVINKQINGKYDILLGIIWKRIGTPTLRDKSGTVEEINRSIEENINGKKIELLLYFNTSSPSNLNDIDPIQLKSVTEFKESLSNRGVLYKEYNSIKEFDSLLRVNLNRLIIDRFLTPATQSEVLNSIELSKSKYSDIENILSQADSNETNLAYDDIFDASLQVEVVFNLMSESLLKITQMMKDYGNVMNAKTDELNKINITIKDIKLKQKKVTLVINTLSKELDDFNRRLNSELPIFSEHLNDGLNKYSNFLLVFKDFQNDESKEIAIGLRNSLEEATRGCANLLKIVMEFPPLNYKFNESKRTNILVLKSLTKELLNGLNLLDEINK